METTNKQTITTETTQTNVLINRGTSLVKVMSVSEFLDLDLFIPTFQRSNNAWETKKQERFINCLLNGSPIPSFMLASVKGNESKLLLIDGLQRMTAINRFVDEFASDDELLDKLLNTNIVVTTFIANEYLYIAEAFIDLNSSSPLSIAQKKKPNLNKEVVRVVNDIAKYVSEHLPFTKSDNYAFFFANMLMNKERASSSINSTFSELAKVDEENASKYDTSSIIKVMNSFKLAYNSLGGDLQKVWATPSRAIQLFNLVAQGHNPKEIARMLVLFDMASTSKAYTVTIDTSRNIKGEVKKTSKREKASHLSSFGDRANGIKSTSIRTQVLEQYINKGDNAIEETNEHDKNVEALANELENAMESK